MDALKREFEHDDLLYQTINPLYRIDEASWVETFLPQAEISPSLTDKIHYQASQLVQSVQKNNSSFGIDAFMSQYNLSSEEGIALLCLAEALLRIPDKATQDKLIADKLTKPQWDNHSSKNHSLFVNAGIWGLMLTGKMLKNADTEETQQKNLTHALKRLLHKGGEPIARQAILAMMKILGRQFVLGRTIEEAIKRSQKKEAKGYRYSYDMLGEAAFTQSDAQKYFAAYAHAIEAIKNVSYADPLDGSGISVKLSALHPRFMMAKRERLHLELLPKLQALIHQAKEANIGLTIDAEESYTLTLTLELIQAIIKSGILKGWKGLGIAVQSYQKRAPAVLDFLIDLLRQHQCHMRVRLVKGAYWDTEIKLAQVQGLSGYPVFTRKVTTDVNYVVCAKKMLAASDVIYSQFATHNALTLATVMALAEEASVQEYEFQCLHGMGEALYDEIIQSQKIPCRIYAPVGIHQDLLPYLVRRLLENGANTSFVNRIQDKNTLLTDILAFPIQKLKNLKVKANPQIGLPKDLYEPHRANSPGVDLSDPLVYIPILKNMTVFSEQVSVVKSNLVQIPTQDAIKRYSPINKSHFLGTVSFVNQAMINEMITKAYNALPQWMVVNAEQRAKRLELMANALEENRNELLSLLVVEAGKTLDDAIAEWREAIDYCHYYGWQVKKHFQEPEELPGPTGEKNLFSLHARGIFFCISPWNFPLAIFLGQVSAALAAGNCVIAKPASQTMLIAAKVINLLHGSGFPKEVVQLLPAKGSDVGEVLGSNPHVHGVLLTGSTATAQDINRKLAGREGAIVPLIAETGGQNAMIVDSSALPEQVTQDVITSAFRSAGQRCSALRVLFLQEDVAEKMLTMLKGAMAELQVGDPFLLSTDVGPVIDDAAKDQLLAHVEGMKTKGTLLFQVSMPANLPAGSFFAPRLYEIESLDILTQEVFGPILHVVRFSADKLDEVIAQINRTGYGLTLGIHSRITKTVEKICEAVQVGNIYVNRNMIGAVVGVQPFGGEKLSGTGPKAGGPYYLSRLAIERSLSINTTASGGNTTLLSLPENE